MVCTELILTFDVLEHLEDPLYGLLFDNSYMPQAERGLYLNSRYRFSHRLTPSF